MQIHYLTTFVLKEYDILLPEKYKTELKNQYQVERGLYRHPFSANSDTNLEQKIFPTLIGSL